MSQCLLATELYERTAPHQSYSIVRQRRGAAAPVLYLDECIAPLSHSAPHRTSQPCYICNWGWSRCVVSLHKFRWVFESAWVVDVPYSRFCWPFLHWLCLNVPVSFIWDTVAHPFILTTGQNCRLPTFYSVLNIRSVVQRVLCRVVSSHNDVATLVVAETATSNCTSTTI